MAPRNSKQAKRYAEGAKMAERILAAYKNDNVCADAQEARKLYRSYGNTATSKSVVGGVSSTTKNPHTAQDWETLRDGKRAYENE